MAEIPTHQHGPDEFCEDCGYKPELKRTLVGNADPKYAGWVDDSDRAIAKLTWDEANLREYIADPQAKVKGNRMPFGGVSNPADLDDVVAYLKTLK